ncbi:hypothetical protein AAY473_025629 [Plecturocebus cupreus]
MLPRPRCPPPGTYKGYFVTNTSSAPSCRFSTTKPMPQGQILGGRAEGGGSHGWAVSREVVPTAGLGSRLSPCAPQHLDPTAALQPHSTHGLACDPPLPGVPRRGLHPVGPSEPSGAPKEDPLEPRIAALGTHRARPSPPGTEPSWASSSVSSQPSCSRPRTHQGRGAQGGCPTGGPAEAVLSPHWPGSGQPCVAVTVPLPMGLGASNESSDGPAPLRRPHSPPSDRGPARIASRPPPATSPLPQGWLRPLCPSQDLKVTVLSPSSRSAFPGMLAPLEGTSGCVV